MKQLPLALLLSLSMAGGPCWAGVDTPPDPGAQPCTAAPAPDTFTGSIGSLPCFTSSDATRPTQVQPGSTTTASDGSWSISWPVAFVSTPTYVHAELLTPGANSPYQCNVLTKSTSGATGKCYAIVGTTLPVLATSLLGLAVSPFTSPTAGLTVMVIARQ